MKPILVTGVAGFIGSKVAQILIKKGLNVIGIDNLNDQYDVSIKHWRLKGLREKKAFQFIELDLRKSVEKPRIYPYVQTQRMLFDRRFPDWKKPFPFRRPKKRKLNRRR